MKTLLAAFALLLVAVAAAADNPNPLYLVVLEPGGGPPPEVAGGTVEYQQGQMRAMRIPEEAVEGLRQNPRVRHIQRVVSASEEIEAPARAVATNGALQPRSEMASPWTTGTYTYDGSGNISSIGPNSDAKTNVYRYDTIGRLSSATIHTPSTPGNVAVAHAESYGYDRYGNLTQITTDGTSIALPASAATNRLSSTLGVTYDAVGNVTTDPSGTVYSYDAANMLRQRGATTYLYTAADERIATVNGTTGARWTLRNLEGKVVREYDSFGPTTGMEYFLWTEDFFHAGSQLVASQRETAEGGRRHYHLGTPLFATNASGSRVSSHAYYPFGVEATSILQERNRGFDRDQPLRYTGHERDGLDSSIAEHNDYIDYMHARYYRAGWGRFLSVDPTWSSADVGRPQSWNRYSYAYNNPVLYADLDGASPGNVTFKIGRWSFHLDWTHSSRVEGPHFDVKKGPKKLGRFQIDKWAAETGDEIPNSAIKVLEEAAEAGRLPGPAMRAIAKYAPETIRVAGRLAIVLAVVMEVASAEDANAEERVSVKEVNQRTQKLFGKNLGELSGQELEQYWRFLRAEAESGSDKK